MKDDGPIFKGFDKGTDYSRADVVMIAFSIAVILAFVIYAFGHIPQTLAHLGIRGIFSE